jgi:hypothetical protein
MKVEANGCGGGVQLLQTPGHGSHVVGVEERAPSRLRVSTRQVREKCAM